MLIKLLEKNDLSKVFQINYMEEQVVLRVRDVSTRSELQVDYVIHRGQTYNRWNGSFMNFLSSCLGRRFEVKKHVFLADLFSKYN
jgi:hypothetical protein